VRDLVDLGVSHIVLIPGGFSETGPAGKELEKKVMEIVKGTETRIIGPNTVGVYFPYAKVNTALTPPDRVSFPGAGDIAFISQSGALGLLTMDSISEFGIGISAFINLGNRIDLDEIELMEHFNSDPNTGSIAIYIESVDNGKLFYETLKRVNRAKPVVVLKSGRTKSSAKAASLHTGSMALDGRIFDGMLRQAGATRAFNEVELIDYSKVLSYSPRLKGKNIAIVTTAGGVGVITADYVSATDHGIGMNLAVLKEETKRRIRDSIIAFGSAENPVDLTADGSPDSYGLVLSALLDDENVDGIIAYALPQTPKMNLGIADIIAKYSESGKPIVVGVIGSMLGTELIKEFENKKIPAYPSIERTVLSIKALYNYSKYMEERNND
jgi:acyl-CoA synthetase (NDP forming)